jgi:ParB family chromosome partitioning protein
MGSSAAWKSLGWKMLARQHGIRRKRNDSGIGKTLIAYVRRVDEGTSVREAT